MSTNSFILYVGGVYNFCFAVFHLAFPYIFKWKEDLVTLKAVNRCIVYVMNLCLSLVFLIFSYISVIHNSELLDTRLGNSILGGIFLFWTLRMIWQILYFGLKKKLSIVFTFIFLLGSVLYLVPLVFR